MMTHQSLLTFVKFEAIIDNEVVGVIVVVHDPSEAVESEYRVVNVSFECDRLEVGIRFPVQRTPL